VDGAYRVAFAQEGSGLSHDDVAERQSFANLD
jgi:hypothetical protein